MVALVNSSSPQPVFDRIVAIHWSDWQTANRHERSRSRLLAEYMRRAALWARDTDGTRTWPFYDVAANVAPSVTTDATLAARLDEYLEQNVGWSGTERVCGTRCASPRSGRHRASNFPICRTRTSHSSYCTSGAGKSSWTNWAEHWSATGTSMPRPGRNTFRGTQWSPWIRPRLTPSRRKRTEPGHPWW